MVGVRKAPLGLHEGNFAGSLGEDAEPARAPEVSRAELSWADPSQVGLSLSISPQKDSPHPFCNLRKVNGAANMGIRGLIRATNYQLLGISFIVMFLGVAVAAVTLWTCFNDKFYVIRNVTMETNNYAKMHDLAVHSGLAISAFLVLLGIICLIGIVRESEFLLSVVLICFALLFCGVVQLAYWRSAYKQVVEDAAKDVYDFLYADYMRNISHPSKQDLINIHSAFSCCGKNSTFSYYRKVENETCFPDHGPQKDCLQSIENQIADNMAIIGVLTTLLGIVTVYGMILTAFFCFAVCLIQIWNKKGKYTLDKNH
ncbi:tetraspanin-32-like [Pristis pectinata]|uniref:tetraspanin-32-like n=1 Tax=Pristis pectinata TaxID=685728 RepID=UPI00223E3FCE|nr:tetraspanin-32-like [Pristis pectinata]